MEQQELQNYYRKRLKILREEVKLKLVRSYVLCTVASEWGRSVCFTLSLILVMYQLRKKVFQTDTYVFIYIAPTRKCCFQDKGYSIFHIV